jgi:hypothetical protein
MEEILAGRRVRIAADPTQDERDRYDRLLAYVWLEDGTFVNEVMVAEGYAHEYTYDLPYRYQAELRAAEVEARENERGLWSPDTCGGDTSRPADQGPPPIAGESAVVISYILYNGAVPDTESDEYAAIANRGGEAVDLSGWVLSAGPPEQEFTFPAFILQPGRTCRVYTNEVHAESCGFSFGSEQPVWRNTGDCGRLFDASGVQASEYCW